MVALLVTLPLLGYSLEPRPLHEDVREAGAIVLARVVAARVPSLQHPADVEIELVVLDAALGDFKKGERFKMRVSYGEPFASRELKVGAAYVLMPKREAGGPVSNALREPFELADDWEPPIVPEAAKGQLWLSASTFTDHTGLMLPKALPLTFTDYPGYRTCRGEWLDARKVWFTWEDLKRIDWAALKLTDYRDSTEWNRVPCSHDAKTPQMVRCSTCGGEPMESVGGVVCTGTESKLRLHFSRMTSVWPARFRVSATNAPKGALFPPEVEANADDPWNLVDFVDATLTPADRREVRFSRKRAFRLQVQQPRDFPFTWEDERFDRAGAAFNGRVIASIDATQFFIDDVVCTLELGFVTPAPAPRILKPLDACGNPP